MKNIIVNGKNKTLVIFLDQVTFIEIYITEDNTRNVKFYMNDNKFIDIENVSDKEIQKFYDHIKRL